MALVLSYVSCCQVKRSPNQLLLLWREYAAGRQAGKQALVATLQSPALLACVAGIPMQCLLASSSTHSCQQLPTRVHFDTVRANMLMCTIPAPSQRSAWHQQAWA